jgi:hypothetical protein
MINHLEHLEQGTMTSQPVSAPKEPVPKPSTLRLACLITVVNLLVDVVTVGLCLFEVTTAVGWWQANRYPSDAEMISHYHAHKSEFNELAQLLIVDNEFDAIDPKEGAGGPLCSLRDRSGFVSIENPKCADYVQRFRALGFKSVDISAGTVRITVASISTWAPRGSTKGYVYRSEAKTYFSYRHIEGGWYIFETR